MPDLTTFPNQLDSKKLQCRAIIETPKNRRNKFDYDPESGLFKLGGLLPEGMMFPFDFGFRKTETNCRLLAVSIHSYSHENVTSIKQMTTTVLDQLEEFFITYNKLRGKKFKVTGRGGPKRALDTIKGGIKSFEKNRGPSL